MGQIAKMFKKMDQASFEQVDKFTTSSQYQKMGEQVGAMTDTQQKIMGQILNILAVVFPLFIVFILFLSNRSMNKKIEMKTEIYNQIIDFQGNKRELQQLGRAVLNPYSLATQTQLKSKLKSVLTSTNVNLDKIGLGEITNFSPNPSINHMEVNLNLSNLSTKELVSVLNAVLNKAKLKASSINLTKDPASKKINGSLSAIYLGKNKANQ